MCKPLPAFTRYSYFFWPMADNSLIHSAYRHLVNSPTFYLIRINLEGLFTYVNPHFAKRFSFLYDDFIGKHYLNTIHEEDLPLCQKAAEACLCNPSEVVPVRLRKPNGQGGYFWSHWEFSAFGEEAEAPREIVCIGYDITETELAQQKAQEYAQKIDIFINNITDSFFVVDREWKFLKVNKVFEMLIGKTEEELLGQSLVDLMPEGMLHSYPETLHKALQEGISINFEEYSPASQRWYEVTIYPSPEGLTVLLKDITEKKIAQEIIRESNNKLTAILNSTTDINILIDPEYRVLSFNKMAVESMRKFYDNRELATGQNILEYILPGTEEEFMRNFQAALSGEVVEVKIRLSFKPGMALWFLVKYYPVLDLDGKIIGVAFNSTNIDKQQRQYEQLSHIASLYSHEIRRPVATILGITQLIHADQLSVENKEWFDYLIQTTRELDRVIQRIVRKTSEIQ